MIKVQEALGGLEVIGEHKVRKVRKGLMVQEDPKGESGMQFSRFNIDDPGNECEWIKLKYGNKLDDGKGICPGSKAMNGIRSSRRILKSRDSNGSLQDKNVNFVGKPGVLGVVKQSVYGQLTNLLRHINIIEDMKYVA